VAAITFNVDPSPEINRNKIITFIDKIKSEQPNVRLILCSETTLGYYYRPSNPFEYQKSIAETIPGETINIIAQKSMEHQIYVSFGMVEKLGEKIYNSQVLLCPDGTIASIHKKYYLTPEDIKSGFKEGRDFTLNVVDGIKVATILCNDLNSIEVNRKIHESGAELVLHPVANGDGPVSDLLPHQYTFAWMLEANRYGNEDGTNYDGLLSLTTPSGERKIRTTGKDHYIYGVVKCP
jgi:predicted amidohydrolase